MNKPWIYWADECDYCRQSYMNYKDRENCPYERRTRLLRMKLEVLQAEYEGAYGSLSFKCDYFTLDEEKYKNSNIYGQTEVKSCN